MKAIVFDMDGVLFDTESYYFRAWDIEGKNAGMSPQEIETIRGMCAGHNPADTEILFNDFFHGKIGFQKFWKNKNNRFHQLLVDEGVPVKTGMYELLNFLKENGWKIALATSTNREGAMYNLTQTKIESYFDVLTTGDMFQHGKPDPDIYLTACRMLGSIPSETYAVEDSYAGLESARRAGMNVVMIPDLFPPTEASKKNTDFIFTTMLELKSFLEK